MEVITHDSQHLRLNPENKIDFPKQKIKKIHLGAQSKQEIIFAVIFIVSKGF